MSIAATCVRPAAAGSFGKKAHRLRRVLPRRRFAGEQQVLRAAARRVIDVHQFRARWYGAMLHGMEHLCGYHDRPAGRAARPHDMLLRARQLPQRHRVAQIAARNNYHIGLLNYLIQFM